MALVALAIQVLLTFSHIDVCDFGASPAKAATLAVGSAPSGPGKNGPTDKSDRPVSCPICALIQLAATAAPATAPALPLLVPLGHVLPQAADQLLLAASAQFPFRARAPPAV